MNTGNNLIYLTVSALLALMGISGFFGKANISRLSVEAELPGEIYAGAPFPLRLTLRNNRRVLPAFLVRVRIAGHDILFPFVDRGSGATRHIDVVFNERGKQVMGNIYACSVFPFNFFIRFTPPFRERNILVFPRLKKGEFAIAGSSAKKTAGESPSRRRGYESEISSIREYAPGDPMKYISWKATARTGSLKTKEFSSLAATPVTIDFERVEVPDLEERISRVSHALLRLLKENIPVGLKIGGKLLKPSLSHVHKTDMLRELALYQAHPPRAGRRASRP